MKDDIRNWAIANGYSVGKRGAVKADIREAYFQAHPGISDSRVYATSRESLADVRVWAASQGIAVGGRGRIHRSVLESYRQSLVCTGDVADAPSVVQEAISPDERIDRLEMMLRSRGLHLSQQEGW